MLETEVLVVGAGPTGLTLALDLAQRGVKTMLVERHERPLYLPKMERTNPRSMEIFRRLGLADSIRAAGYPADVAMDIFIVNSLAEPPLLQLKFPSVNEAKAHIRFCQDASMPLEPYQLISQYTLEPLMLDAVKRHPNVVVKQGAELVGLQQDANGVSATLQTKDGEVKVRSKYLAGCDGGTSFVRKHLGIELEGTGVISTARQVFFECEDFYEKCKVPPGRHYYFAHKESAKGGIPGVIVVQDDRKHFGLHSIMPVDHDWVTEIRELTGLDIHPTIISVNEWRQNIMVANRYADGRIFMAGDACHLFIPAGGLGMNTGVCDAYDLSWKLAGAVQGWGGPQLLASYETERRPVGLRNTAAAYWAAQGVLEWRKLYNDKVHTDPVARAEFAEKATPFHRRIFDMSGIERGYRYESAIVAKEDGVPPADTTYIYRPSTWPGMRVPHIWLDNGDALHDRMGKGYVLLKLGAEEKDTTALELAMRATGAPFEVLRLKDARVGEALERNLVLVRPDLHVCWRGNDAPTDPERLAATATGKV